MPECVGCGETHATVNEARWAGDEGPDLCPGCWDRLKKAAVGDEVVYRTRIVFRDRGRQDEGMNHWADPAEAKLWLEEYVRIRWDAEPSEWVEETAGSGEKWTMHPDGLDGRAVVMGHQVRKNAGQVLGSVRETMTKIRGGDD